MHKSYSKTRILVEGALMVALATILSMIKVFEMPFGGSVTLLSMLPLVLMSFRHGTRWGLLTAFVHSVLQMVLGFSNVGYCPTLLSQVGCILLDYILAFTALGLAYAFSRPFKNRFVGVIVGTAIVCAIRFLCSWLSGMLIWGSYKDYYEWAVNMPVWLYSLVYNGNYMLPETAITVIGTVFMVKGASKLFEMQK